MPTLLCGEVASVHHNFDFALHRIGNKQPLKSKSRPKTSKFVFAFMSLYVGTVN